MSEGSLQFSKKTKTPSAIYISQTEGGKIESFINKIIDKYNIKKTICFRQHINKNEITYRIQDKDLASKFLVDFGHGCTRKKMPSYFSNFSKRQILILFRSLMAGDGNYNKKGHKIYYSSSKELIDNLQFLLFVSGMATQIYCVENTEENHSKMYQLFVSKIDKQHEVINKKFSWHKDRKNSGWTKRNVECERIVCFSVSGSILITRNNNKIAVHGNSKNMAHCIRLLKSAVNIFENGEPLVRLENGPDKDLLLNIRHGKMSYNEIMELANDLQSKLEHLKAKSDLPLVIDDYIINKMLDDCQAIMYSYRDNMRNLHKYDHYQEFTHNKMREVSKDSNLFINIDYDESNELNQKYEKEDLVIT